MGCGGRDEICKKCVEWINEQAEWKQCQVMDEYKAMWITQGQENRKRMVININDESSNDEKLIQSKFNLNSIMKQ